MNQHTYPIIKPKTFTQFLKNLEAESPHIDGYYTFFRGQSNSDYLLLSTSARVISKNNVPWPINDIVGIEGLLEYFKRFHPREELISLQNEIFLKRGKYIEPHFEIGPHVQQNKEKSKIKNLDVSKPVRTPFLDCSRNRLVALFFANTELERSSSESPYYQLNRIADGAVWIINIHSSLAKANFQSVVDHTIFYKDLLSKYGTAHFLIPPSLCLAEAKLRDLNDPKPERQEA